MINSVHTQVRPDGAGFRVFTACAPAHSLLEAITEAAKDAPAGDADLLSPACSSFDSISKLPTKRP